MRVTGAAASLSCSCLCMTKVVYGAMFSDDGKRTAASILRAADLSTDLCSKRCVAHIEPRMSIWPQMDTEAETEKTCGRERRV